ncbi:hypothetical protein WN48_02704 [Eufriesea mexicana]|uniref:Ig-like domain-containing protein n=1 Tax=Eufriesea mexicana TaxID=516756 RepID=A0A310SG89_9HYME|nr:hypothetical protein WN48_02704 [Eufriesea mexicana]
MPGVGGFHGGVTKEQPPFQRFFLVPPSLGLTLFHCYSRSTPEARARINGTSDIYVNSGSLLTLTCLMSQGPHDLGTVAWFRGNQPVMTSPHSENDVNGEPRITVETEWSDALTSSINAWRLKSCEMRDGELSKERSLEPFSQVLIGPMTTHCVTQFCFEN